MTPAERKLRAQLAAHTRWARCEDRRAATEPARRAQQERYERQVDPDGVLPPAERAKRVRHAQAAHLAKMRLARLSRTS